jgi:hypothetical protein
LGSTIWVCSDYGIMGAFAFWHAPAAVAVIVIGAVSAFAFGISSADLAVRE